ncbi:MAG TPA: PQQ-binding-like beta-propeller repeat protein [Gemmataceae bacterium]|nr:PQQ-binding-like beta-propeller repeat protein [Gemmataceae bacterium]
MRRVIHWTGRGLGRHGLGLAVLAVLGLAVARADDWPQWLGPQRDGVWRETGLVEKFPPGGPRVRWETPVGIGYAGPAVANGRVYITDRLLAPGVKNPESGFDRPALPGKERVLCLDEKTGRVLWTYEYDCTYEIAYPGGPRTTPLVSGGKVYTLGAMGDLYCLEAAKGTVIWSKNFMKDYDAPAQQWGFSAHPLLDGDKLICLVGGPGSTAVAFHKDTGKELWRSMNAREQGYSPPVIYDVAGRRQLIIWHPEAVNGLDPETGKVYWSVPFKVRAGLSVPMPRLAGDRLLVSSFYNGSMMLKLGQDDKGQPTATVLWRGKSQSEQPRLTDTLHSIIPTPVIKDGYIYGICSYGELRCLRADTGERLWETHQPTTGESVRWGNAFLVPNGNRFILFNEKGDLILARLTPKGYEEISRANILEPTNTMPRRPVVWSHPAFANKCVYARNDKKIICVSLAQEDNR